MNVQFLQVLGWVGIAVAFFALVMLLDALLLRLANRFANRSAQYPHRIGTQLPRVIEQ